MTEESKNEIQQASCRMSIKQTFITIIISAVISAAMIYGYNEYYAQKIVTYDLRTMVLEQAKLREAGKIDDKQIEQAFDDAKRVINGQPKNHVVILGEVVLNGAKRLDKTAEKK